ncbi:hypothetical protein AA313_de0204852 [Arthrobotrys entomopaga]|nr:hypothetical protein AA313_de0204852 [Arthrobotrys entomopaga]
MAADPAHPSNPNENHTTKRGNKPTSGTEVLTDTSFVPTLESAPSTRYLQSFLVLFMMVSSAAFSAWFLDFDIFQSKAQQQLVLLGVIGGLFYSGAVWIDWWTIVVEYWWISIPLLAGLGIIVVRLDEGMRLPQDLD